MQMTDKQWSPEMIKVAFDRFIAENGRLPMAPEVDRTSYLPSSRQIQRKFGGLRELRRALGYEQTDFGKGSHRTEIARSGNLRGKDAEKELQDELAEMFGEPYVHSEKYYGPGRNRADFIVYTRDGILGIDVFTTETVHDLQKNVAIKVDKYIDFPRELPLFFVVVSRTLSDTDVSEGALRMTKLARLPNVRVVTPRMLFAAIESMKPFENPEGFISLYH